ncbi:hypothetical protein DPMN_122663 [Dreissena polymorpha]|uniref:Secreted protein n=1 Tax=Dreissena polymorpha TaxID=45954 RepID=A0A9D4GPF3_DREPO|nr:hypothetical protein DPMN_122663 [Dreissena polymorpha]
MTVSSTAISLRVSLFLLAFQLRSANGVLEFRYVRRHDERFTSNAKCPSAATASADDDTPSN